MKKYLIIASAALVALASCSKEQPAPVVNEDETVYLTFTSGRPQLDILSTNTKTEWNTNRIVWSAGDKIRVGYKKDGSWMGQSAPGTAKFYKSEEVSINGTNASVGTFSVPISGSAFTDPAESDIYQFFAVYPGDAISGTDVADPTAKKITLPATQTPGSNTFDKTADIMVGQSEASSLSGLPTDPIEIDWTRLVAHADLTFSNLAFDGAETINKITLTFNSEAKVAGSFEVNIPAGTAGEGNTNVITINGTNITPGANSAEAWACVLPVTFTSLDVELKTNKAVYARSITGINKTFKQNARNTLTVNMSTASRTPITELIANGNYVIAAKSSETYYAISSDVNASSQRRDRVEITTASFNPNNYSVGSPYIAANDIVWTVTNVTGGVNINLAVDTDKYMQYGNNTLPLGSSGVVFSVSVGSEDGTYSLENSSRHLCMNGSYGFGCYDNNQDLYFIPATGTPTMTFPVTNKTVDAETTSVEFSYTSAFLSDTPVVSITSDTGSAVADTDIAAGTLTITLNENATAFNKNVTLTVSATGATPVVLTITQAGAVGDANNGDILWAEDFGGFSANDVPATSNASTEVYGSKTVTYSVGDGGGTTKVYAATMAGGSSPELLIAKNSGYLTATGIPTGSATGMTLSFKANNDNVVVSSTTVGATISYIGKSGSTYTYSVTVPNATKVLNLTFTNDAGVETNIRIDDILLVAGAPVPGITVSTSAATATATAAGTTATLNGTITLMNGAVNGSVSDAGFYYKLTSAGAYTKVTCASAPTSTTSFSYDLTGLTKDAEYTYYAYAIYDSGSEVIGETKTFTPTQSGGGGGTVTFDFSSLTETVTGGWNGAHTVSPITITATAANTNKAGQVRFQKDGTVTFSGATITRIEIVNSGSYPGDFSANTGSYSLNGNNGIWTGSATTVVLTNNGNGTRTTSIQVTYN
ncbi:MAG: hypothetical protein J6X57_00495 [Bacteroidales bacterium]|nr:hypothetical protein [Bacteroidales bacterium]